MGLSYRSIRAAGSAVLVAAAVGAGGMTGMASALANEATSVAVSGTLVDGSGQPLAGVHLTLVEELPPDGGIAAVTVTTAADGSFGADLYAWGTTDAPATLTVKTGPDEELQVTHEACSQTWGVAVSDARQLALSQGPPEPLTVSATTTLLGEACGVTGTPGGGANGGTGGGDSRGGTAELTPPPTDVHLASAAAGPDRLATALSIGFAGGLLLAAVFLLPVRRTRRR